jgi:Ni/Fe-hydrogenase subunit HybB-like protein
MIGQQQIKKELLVPPMDRTDLVPVIAPGQTFESVNEQIGSIVLRRGFQKQWLIGFAIAFLFLMIFLGAVSYLFLRGVGIWGINIPVGWGFAIINLVWWIGIGHAGTLISAILLLLRQSWRTSINRFAEAMTLFAVSCAALFPILHLGRPQYFFWLMPYPTTMDLWPQFRSPLMWDFFAILTYATVSALFWFVGWSPTSPHLGIERRVAGRKLSSACFLWAGGALPGIGSATMIFTSCWPRWQRRWSSLCTAS